jgi:UDP-N-acetylglucosamine:LPS N-acetylglucosamine transferase
MPIVRKKRIFIPMIEVGGGHKSIGLAIRDAIDRQYPGEFETAVVDFPRVCGAVQVDRWIKSFWNVALAHPVATNRLNGWMDNMYRVARSNTFTRVLNTDFVQKGSRYIREYQPDIIISTHWFCTSVAVFAREKYRLDCRIVSHVNDPFRANSLWVNPLADEMIVCSDNARDHMIRLGQPPATMTVMPFPLNGRFFDPIARTREDILQGLGLDPKRLTVLASSGGEGIGNTETYIRELYLSNLPINLIAVCGRNERMLREMRLLAARSSTVRFAPLGFADNMNELAFASDIGLAKAGPSTMLEMLSKGCPVMITQVAHHAEQGNLDFVEREGFGWDVRDRNKFEEMLTMLREPGFLEPVRRRIGENQYIRSLPDGAARLAAYLVEGMKKPRKTFRTRTTGFLAHARFAERRRQLERRKMKLQRKVRLP